VPLPRCAGGCHQARRPRLAMPPRVAEGPCAVVCCRLYGRERPHRDCCGPPIGRLAAEGARREEAQARLDAWAEAHKRFHLSDLHIQMAA